MPKYECRTCENTFVQAATANRQCPACGSNNIYEVYEEIQQPDTFRSNIGIIVSCIVVVLMLIVLFVLPAVPHRYLASVKNIPEYCGLSFNITEYGYPVNSANFRFSVDNGKNWKEDSAFISHVACKYQLNVKEANEEDDTIYYSFTNPYSYKPAISCIEIPPDPCDCKNLRITGVEKIPISNRDAIVVHVSLPKCGIEYSISGINGKYQQDSVFSRFTPKDSIFVKSAKCTPVAYSGNPFVAVPVVAVVAKPNRPQPAVTSGKQYPESEVNPKPYPPSYESRQELEEYLSQEIQKEIGSHREIVIAFTVETTGDLSGFKNINNVSQTLHDCAKRKINKGGSWYPGYKSDNPVDTYVIIRIPAN